MIALPNRFIVLLATAAFVAPFGVSAQEGPNSPTRALPAGAVRISARNSPSRLPRRWRPGTVIRTGLTVVAEGRQYLVPLTGRVGTWRIDSVLTLAAATRADTSYVLAEVGGRSSAREGGGGYCGAGQERDLVWLKLSQGRVREVRSAPYSSCLTTLNGDDEPYQRNADSLWFDGTMFRRNREISIRYFFAQPALGLRALVDTLAADSLPRYPRSLVAAGVEGEVTVRTDPRSGATRDSVRIVSASHPLFADAVARAVGEWRMDDRGGSTGSPLLIRFDFTLRRDAGCAAQPATTRAWERPRGYRAAMMPSPSANERRVLVEACAVVTRRAVVAR